MAHCFQNNQHGELVGSYGELLQGAWNWKCQQDNVVPMHMYGKWLMLRLNSKTGGQRGEDAKHLEIFQYMRPEDHVAQLHDLLKQLREKFTKR